MPVMFAGFNRNKNSKGRLRPGPSFLCKLSTGKAINASTIVVNARCCATDVTGIREQTFDSLRNSYLPPAAEVTLQDFKAKPCSWPLVPTDLDSHFGGKAIALNGRSGLRSFALDKSLSADLGTTRVGGSHFCPTAALIMRLPFSSTRLTSNAISMDMIAGIANKASSLMRFEGRFEQIFAGCVYETARRSSNSLSIVRRRDDVSATSMVATANILSLACEEFAHEVKMIDSSKREVLRQGPWRHNWGNWFFSMISDRLYSRRQGQVPKDMQLHFTEAHKPIAKIASYIGRCGPAIINELTSVDSQRIAASISTALKAIISTGCMWLAGDMAASLSKFNKELVLHATGDPALVIEGKLLAHLEGTASGLGK